LYQTQLDGQERPGPGLDAQEVDAQEVDGQELDGQELDGQELDGQELDAQEVDAQEVDAQEVDLVEWRDVRTTVRLLCGAFFPRDRWPGWPVRPRRDVQSRALADGE
jgi:hypothetical protein